MVIHGFTLRNRGHLSVRPLQKDFIKHFILKKKKKKTEKMQFWKPTYEAKTPY